MFPMDNFTKYLHESKDDVEDKATQMSIFIYKNDLLNILYTVSNHQDRHVAKIAHIGAPNQLIDILSHSVTVPLKQIDIDIETTPVLRRVYAEKKSIYFRKLPELIAGLIPDIKHQQQARMILQQLDVTDVAVLPVVITNPKYQKEYILAVLGPLTDEQKQFIKNVSQELTNYFNNQPA